MPGRGWNERNPPAAMRSDKGRTLFGGTIDIRGKKLSVPVQLLGHVSLVVDVYSNLLAFLKTKQRSRELTVVGRRRNDAIRGQFHRRHGDGQGIIWRRIGFFRRGCRSLLTA